MKKLNVLLALSFLFSVCCFSQDVMLPKNHPLAAVAPHLPVMEKYDGVGKAFNGVNTTYKKEQNETSLKLWMKNYPAEYVKYKDAIASYLEKNDPETATSTDKELYQDLKSQWLMMKQLPK